MQIQHKEGRFFIEINGKHAILDYALEGKEMDIFHTFTDEELRGRGLAEKLALAAFDHAKKNGLRVKPTCDYIQEFVKKHPEYVNITEQW
ncbi:MAG TPA: GNAT family N-acetyltransferase [archaeon]|nr:GNAT family N-acetyltransferase [archaeon]